MVETIFVLLIVYQIKHFLADYPLQTSWMLGKFKEKGWVAPLAAHAGFHALFTFVIAACYLGIDKGLFLLALAAFDFVCHFTMDRIKASSKLLGRFKALSGTEFMSTLERHNFSTSGLEQAKESLAAGSVATALWESNKEFYESEIKFCMRKFKHNTYFWWALGLDQGFHHLTDLAIVYFLITHN